MLDDSLIKTLRYKYLETLNDFGFLVLDNEDPEAILNANYNDSSVSRLMQAIGAFSRLSANGKEGFVQYIEPAFSRLLSRLEKSSLCSIRDLCFTIAPQIFKD
jgi:hypothetical protein